MIFSAQACANRIYEPRHNGKEYMKQGRKAIIAVWVAATCLPFTAVPALAHHSFGAEYDGDRPVTLTGVVTKIEWTNPHSYFHIDVTDKDGAVASWKFEGYPPSVLIRNGWKREVTMKVGDTVTIYGWRARDNSNTAHSRTVTFKDGKKLESGPPAGNGDGSTTDYGVTGTTR